MTSPTAPPRCSYQSYQSPVWLLHAPCPEPAWDGESRCFFHSLRADKPADEMARQVKEKLAGGGSDFAGYVFPAGTDLSNVSFGDGADFGGGTFGDGADFGGAIFGDGAIFGVATFGNGASFGNATFGDGADFSDASFDDGADFEGASFGDGANFSDASFGDWADFGDATFGDRASFWLASFGDEADFGVATFGKDTLFEGDPPEDRRVFSGSVYFEGARLGGVIFRRVALPDASFGDAVGLDSAEFDRVEWGQRGGRPAVADEDTARQSGGVGDCEAAERVYREIRRSYLNRRDFTMARQFHYGEMEMRRLGQRARLGEAKGLLSWLSAVAETALISAYRAVSGYGTRWQRALVWLLGLWFLSACGYTAELLLQSYEFGRALTWGLLQSLLSLILRPAYTPLTPLGQLLGFFEMAFAAILVTALIFAVREQFRR